MKIKSHIIHRHDDKKIIDQDIVQEEYGYVGKYLSINVHKGNSYEFSSLEEYIKKSNEQYNSRFICVTKFSAFEIYKIYSNCSCITNIYFIELIK